MSWKCEEELLMLHKCQSQGRISSFLLNRPGSFFFFSKTENGNQNVWKWSTSACQPLLLLNLVSFGDRVCHSLLLRVCMLCQHTLTHKMGPNHRSLCWWPHVPHKTAHRYPHVIWIVVIIPTRFFSTWYRDFKQWPLSFSSSTGRNDSVVVKLRHAGQEFHRWPRRPSVWPWCTSKNRMPVGHCGLGAPQRFFLNCKTTVRLLSNCSVVLYQASVHVIHGSQVWR